MDDTADTAPPLRLSAEPQLFVSDIAASCDFYTRVLGFAEAFRHGEPAFYAQVVRDGARLNLRHVDTPCIDPEHRDREELLSASVVTGDVTPLFTEYQTAGAVFAQELTRQVWGAETFIVRDPDGNLILFAGRAT